MVLLPIVLKLNNCTSNPIKKNRVGDMAQFFFFKNLIRSIIVHANLPSSII